MTAKSYREKMPLYAQDNAFAVSGQQLRAILKGRNPFKKDSPNYDHVVERKGYRITQLQDGTYWVENFRDGAPMFAPDYWWKMSDAAGRRARKT